MSLEVERIHEAAHPGVIGRLTEQDAGAAESKKDFVGWPAAFEHVPHGHAQKLVLTYEQQKPVQMLAEGSFDRWRCFDETVEREARRQ